MTTTTMAATISSMLTTTTESSVYFGSSVLHLDPANRTGNCTGGTTLGKTSIVPAVMLLVFGVGGNILAIIILLCTSKRHKWDNFHRLVAALTVSDFIGLVAPLSLIIASYVNNRIWEGGYHTCALNAFCFIFAGMASVTFAALMSVDRFTGVFLPIFYRKINTVTRSNILIALIWILSFVVAILPVIGVNKYMLHYPGTWCFFNYFADTPAAIGYSYFYAVFGVLVVVLMLILNSMVIVFLIKRSCQKRRRPSLSTNVSHYISNLIRDIYNIVFLVVLMVAFAICWLPLMRRIFTNQSGNGGGKVNLLLDLDAIHLAVTNTVVDPWIYIILRKEFLIKLYRLITCKKSKQGEESPQMCVSGKNANTATGCTDTL